MPATGPLVSRAHLRALDQKCCLPRALLVCDLQVGALPLPLTRKLSLGRAT